MPLSASQTLASAKTTHLNHMGDSTRRLYLAILIDDSSQRFFSATLRFSSTILLLLILLDDSFRMLGLAQFTKLISNYQPFYLAQILLSDMDCQKLFARHFDRERPPTSNNRSISQIARMAAGIHELGRLAFGESTENFICFRFWFLLQSTKSLPLQVQ